MDAEEFRGQAKKLVDFIADYHLSHSDRSPLASDQPLEVRRGAEEKLRFLAEPPEAPMRWDDVMQHFVTYVFPGISHWQHPKFFSFYPHGHSFPSVCADLLSTGLGSVSFKNDISPIYGELEKLVMIWMTRLLGLPKCLEPGETAGGILMGSASEGMNLAVVAARNRIFAAKEAVTLEEKLVISSRLVLFCSAEAHLTVRKAAEFFLMRLRVVPTGTKGILDPKELDKAIQEELAFNRLPFLVVATIGTTSICEVDPIAEIGPICQLYGCWLHVDAAYAGAALVCPEFRAWLKGSEMIDSLVINAHKWFLVHFDCSLFWIKDIRLLRISTQKVNTLYGYGTSDFHLNKDPMFCHVPFGRRFRALKLWFVILSFGVEGLQKHIQRHIRLAKLFEDEIVADERFELATPSRAALVCFRLKAGNQPTRALEILLRDTQRVDIRSASFPGTGDVILRFCICSPYTTAEDVLDTTALVKSFACQALQLDFQEQKLIDETVESDSQTPDSNSQLPEPNNQKEMSSEKQGLRDEDLESEGQTLELNRRRLELSDRTKKTECDQRVLKIHNQMLEFSNGTLEVDGQTTEWYIRAMEPERMLEFFSRTPEWYDRTSESDNRSHELSRTPESDNRVLYGRTSEWHRRTSESEIRTPEGYGRTPEWYGRTPERYGRTSEGFGRTSEGFGRTPEGYGRTSEGYGRTPERYGRTPEWYGPTPEWYGRTPEGFGRTPEWYGRTPEGYGRTPERCGRSPDSCDRTQEWYGRIPKSGLKPLKLDGLTLVEMAGRTLETPAIKKMRHLPRSGSLDCLSRLEL